MSLLDAVALTKSCQHMDAFRRQLPHGVFQGKQRDGLAVGGFDEPGVHEALTHRSCHLLRHGKCCCRRRRDDSRRIFGIGHPIGLGEFQGTQVVDGFLGGEGVLDFLESYPVGRQRQAHHQRGEEIFKISGKRPFLIRHPEQSRRGLMHLVLRPVDGCWEEGWFVGGRLHCGGSHER